jgi:hypothetical protein
MWTKFLEFGKQIVSLTRDVQQNKEDVKALREENKDRTYAVVAINKVGLAR